MIGWFSGEDLRWLAHVTVRLQLCRLIREKYSSLCPNHIWGNWNCYDYSLNCTPLGPITITNKGGFRQTITNKNQR